MNAITQLASVQRIDLDARRKGLGGSDIAAVLGISPYKSAYEVYEEKVNGYCKDLSNNEKVQSGIFLEDGIAKWYENVKGVGTFKPTTIRTHKDLPFLLANPDRLVAGKKIGVEIKNVGERSKHLWGEDGSQVVPDYYFLQAGPYADGRNAGREGTVGVAAGNSAQLHAHESHHLRDRVGEPDRAVRH